MAYVLLAPMGKKNEFIRIRADDVLKAALAKAAERDIRTEADEARYLLMKALGIIAEEITPYQRGTPRPKTKRDTAARPGRKKTR